MNSLYNISYQKRKNTSYSETHPNNDCSFQHARALAVYFPISYCFRYACVMHATF